VRLEPKYAEAHTNLGILYRDCRRDLAAAEDEFRAAVRCDSARGELARTHLGDMLQVGSRTHAHTTSLRRPPPARLATSAIVVPSQSHRRSSRPRCGRRRDDL